MQRLSNEWIMWIEEVLLSDPTEDVTYEVGLAALPSPDVAGQFIGYMVIEMMIPGYPLSTHEDPSPTTVTHRTLLPPFAPKEQVQDNVRTLLSELIERRDVPEDSLGLGTDPSPNVGVWRPLRHGMDTP